jgi:drug/metabolite transporter (DMT)-like permease
VQKAIPRPPEAKPHEADLILLGSICGLLSAVGYTAANVCLRAASDVDPVWVSAVKAVPTVVIFGPYLAWRAAKALPIGPSPRAFWMLAATGLFGQVGGNVAFQWSLAVIGLALAVPLCLGMMIVFGAWLGWSLLGERVTWRTIASMVVLFIAVTIVCLGAPTAQASLAQAAAASPLLALAGAAAACASGFAYALLGVAIRNAARHGAPTTSSLVTVGLVGMLALLPLAYTRIGWAGMAATTANDWFFMLGAGVANAVAFFLLVKSLQMTSIAHVNALNATQAAMAAGAGVLIFGEPLSTMLGLGIVLTAVGLLLMDARAAKRTVISDAAVGSGQSEMNLRDEVAIATAEARE